MTLVEMRQLHTGDEVTFQGRIIWIVEITIVDGAGNVANLTGRFARIMDHSGNVIECSARQLS